MQQNIVRVKHKLGATFLIKYKENIAAKTFTEYICIIKNQKRFKIEIIALEHIQSILKEKT